MEPPADKVTPIRWYAPGTAWQKAWIRPEGSGTNSSADVLHQDLHRRLGVLVLEENLDAPLVGVVGHLGYPLDETAPHLRVGSLESVVVPLCPRPDDEVRPHLRAQVHAALEGVDALSAQAIVRVDEGTQGVGRVGVEPCGDHGQVHTVLFQDREDLLDVLLVDLAGVVVLEAIKKVREPLGYAPGLVYHRLAGGLRVVAGRHEAGNGRPESPDAHAVLRH